MMDVRNTSMGSVFKRVRRVLEQEGLQGLLRHIPARLFPPLLNDDYRCPPPAEYFVEPGNICNLECPFCHTGLRTEGFRRGLLTLANYRIILNKIARFARHVGLYNYGEPFLNKDILAMVAMTVKRSIRVTIDSNLTLRDFDEREAVQIVTSGLTVLSASIDGASQETYAQYRRGGSFDRAIRNLALVRSIRDKLGSRTPELRWSFLVNKFKENEVEKARTMAIGMGFTIAVNLLDVWGNKAWESTRHEEARLRFAEASSSKGHAVAPLPVPLAQFRLHQALPYWCIQPFNLMTINWDGQVFPCCTVCDDRHSLGNLLTSDLEAIWNGVAYRKCRRFLHNYGPRQQCDSVCELSGCGVTRKHLDIFNSTPPLTDVLVIGMKKRRGVTH